MKPFPTITLFLLIALMLLFPGAGSQTRVRQKAVRRSNSLAQEIAATRRAGLPTRPQDLRVPLPPPEQNAALVYKQLEDLLKAKPIMAMVEEEVIELHRRKTPPDDAVQEARRILVDRQDILGLIHGAAARSRCVFQRDWASGPDLQVPEFALIRRASRWISAESYLLLLDGKPMEAVRNQALGFRLARHAASDPMLLSYLVGVAVNGITLVGFEKILYEAGRDPAVAEAVRRTIEKEFPRPSLARALRGEFVMVLVLLEMVRKGGWEKLETALDVSVPSMPLGPGSPRWNAYIDSNGAYALRALRRIVGAADRPYLEAQKEIGAVVAGLRRKASVFALAFAMFPLFENVVRMGARLTAEVDILRAAAAALAWKARRGAFPQALGQALKPVPIDPFDGKPLKYRREGEGFVVYSVGEQGCFDGGTPDAQPHGLQLYFRYPMPEWLK